MCRMIRTKARNIRRNIRMMVMTPKTERFEMRLDPVLLERVDDWRGTQSDFPSRAEAIRRLIEAGVTERPKEKFRPTHAERLIIWLLTELLKNQKGQADSMELIQDALFSGHFWYFDDMGFSMLMHDDIDSPSSLSLVINNRHVVLHRKRLPGVLRRRQKALGN